MKKDMKIMNARLYFKNTANTLNEKGIPLFLNERLFLLLSIYLTFN